MFRARLLHRTRLNRSILTEYLATSSGSTALVGAVVRGDVEIVKILLENGADPSVENDLGMNAFEICDDAGPFPSVYRALREHMSKE